MVWINGNISIYMPPNYGYRMCPYWVRTTTRVGKLRIQTRYMYRSFMTYKEAAEYAYSLQSDLTEAYKRDLFTK